MTAKIRETIAWIFTAILFAATIATTTLTLSASKRAEDALKVEKDFSDFKSNEYNPFLLDYTELKGKILEALANVEKEMQTNSDLLRRHMGQ